MQLVVGVAERDRAQVLQRQLGRVVGQEAVGGKPAVAAGQRGRPADLLAALVDRHLGPAQAGGERRAEPCRTGADDRHRSHRISLSSTRLKLTYVWLKGKRRSGSLSAMGRLPLSACWTLPDHVDQAAERWPDQDALVYGADRATFASFAERTLTFAAALQARGIVHGDRVGVLMPNCLDTLVAIYGTSRLGAIPVPINNRFRAPELEHVFGHSGMKLLVTATGRIARRGAQGAARPAGRRPRRAVLGRLPGRGGRPRSGPAPPAPRRRRRHRDADVHLGHHGAPEGLPAEPRGARPHRPRVRRAALPDGRRRPPVQPAAALSPRHDPAVQRLPRRRRGDDRHGVLRARRGPGADPARSAARSRSRRSR